jgi:ankyrin repeat protein
MLIFLKTSVLLLVCVLVCAKYFTTLKKKNKKPEYCQKWVSDIPYLLDLVKEALDFKTNLLTDNALLKSDRLNNQLIHWAALADNIEAVNVLKEQGFNMKKGRLFRYSSCRYGSSW